MTTPLDDLAEYVGPGVFINPDSLMIEREMAQNIVDEAKLWGWLVHRVYNSRQSPEGWPDLTLVKGDFMLLAELKSAKGKLTPTQTEWLDALGQVERVRAELWRPADLADIYRMLATEGRHSR